jgi:hypothetical protein
MAFGHLSERSIAAQMVKRSKTVKLSTKNAQKSWKTTSRRILLRRPQIEKGRMRLHQWKDCQNLMPKVLARILKKSSPLVLETKGGGHGPAVSS